MCGKIEPREMFPLNCFFCEKVIVRDRWDSEEIGRLRQIGELGVRRQEKRVETKRRLSWQWEEYPICGDCIRKERAEDEAFLGDPYPRITSSSSKRRRGGLKALQ
jgi:hypothetical protein